MSNAANGVTGAPENVTLPTTRETTFRWKVAAAVVAISLAWTLLVHWWFGDDGTYRIMFLLPVVFGLPSGLLLWWTFLSGLKWKVRLAGLALVAASVGWFFAEYRVIGFYGEMIPILESREVPTVAERAEAYWKSRSAREKSQPSTSDEKTKTSAPSDPLNIADDDWPAARGLKRDGVMTGLALRTDWEKRPPKLLWKHPVGAGWSGFSIVDGLAFTQEQRGSEECVVCYDAVTGDQVWVHADKTRFDEAMGGPGPRATPTVTKSHLYTLGANGTLNCLTSRAGKPVWSRNILADAGGAKNLNWAMSGSPLVYEDLVIVNPGGGKGKGVIAYDRLTGKIRWSVSKEPAGYAGARVETIQGVAQLLVFDGTGLSAYDPANGHEFWRFGPWENGPQINVAQPIVRKQKQVFISTGYQVGSTLLNVERTGKKWRVSQTWETPNRFKLKFNDGVCHDSHVYGLDEGILACIDYGTGKQRWKGGRFGYGQLLLVDDLLLVLTETGEVVLVKATPDRLTIKARFQAIEGKTWNYPAITNGRLFVRNAAEAACFDLR
jgi:outer membrane protein assembly factor BamB